jgi:hypothetical protein
MNRSRALAPALVLLALTATSRPAAGAWPHEPNVGNLPVCTADGQQSFARTVTDGAGGMIVVWTDVRSGTDFDLYTQRISAAGVPLWTVDGLALCTLTGSQDSPAIVADGAGGAIIAWQDSRSGSSTEVYAQRISAAGATQWTADGVALCTSTNQGNPVIASDGAGGAIVAWKDWRSGTNTDLYAQRISAAGAVQWSSDGVDLCTDATDSYSPAIVSDGAGGAIVSWNDARSGEAAIYMQRIGAAGTLLWAADGVALGVTPGGQMSPMMVADGAGGAIVAWYDGRSGTDFDIYAERIGPEGWTRWTGMGVALCAATGDQQYPAIVSDGAGGAIVTWTDYRNGTNHDIYAQRISTGGTPQWMADGVALCLATGGQFSPAIASDGAGGAIVTWTDYRNGGYSTGDIYARRVTAAGAPQWTADGAALCSAISEQNDPQIASDGAGGAIVVWTDLRSSLSFDLYAQRIERFGQLGNPEPAIASVKDVPNDQGGRVKVSWRASYLDADPAYGVHDYVVWRSVPPSALTARMLLARGATRDAAEAVAGGRFLILASAGADYYWETVGTQPAAGLAGYSMPVTTLGDSVGGSNPRTAFMVEARSSTSLSSPHWFSAPDSGYSVDNLAPAVPAPFTGQYAAGTTRLHWSRNREADLAGYRLYRGTSTAFVPGPANLVGALPDTGYADPAGAPYVYKLTAVDSHGNESPVATLVPGGTVDVNAGAPTGLSFAAPSPNPARGGTMLDYTLSRAGHVRLSVFDAAGRRVQVLCDAEQAAGAHRERFELRGEAGRELASGLYLVRLEAEGRVLTRRLAAIR